MHDRARMQKACELVLHSGSSITEIASRLGFSTVHNFSRAFKREIGVSPRSYRERTYALRGS
jgi:AraC-like DNA-binding protein